MTSVDSVDTLKSEWRHFGIAVHKYFVRYGAGTLNLHNAVPYKALVTTATLPALSLTIS